jgi:hypothetical protein
MSCTPYSSATFSPRCDNAIFTEARDRFDSFSRPMVYVPGDNEWTDCHVGGQDPIERLAHLRKVMFPSNHSFGKRTLTLEQQPQYPENLPLGDELGGVRRHQRAGQQQQPHR